MSSARSVLQVLRLLTQHPEGVGADRVADAVGKSRSTAYHLLASLCEEGFAVRLEGGGYRALDAVPPESAQQERLTRAVEQLFFRTRKRSYLGTIDGGAIEIAYVRGRQGVARMPGLGTRIQPAEAHSLAMGKVVLALLPRPVLERHVARGLARFTEHTVTHPRALVAELDVGARRRLRDRPRGAHGGLLLRRGADVRRPRPPRRRARPVRDAHVFDAEREALASAVLDVARSGGSWIPGSSGDARLSCPPARRTEEFRASARAREE